MLVMRDAEEMLIITPAPWQRTPAVGEGTEGKLLALLSRSPVASAPPAGPATSLPEAECHLYPSPSGGCLTRTPVQRGAGADWFSQGDGGDRWWGEAGQGCEPKPEGASTQQHGPTSAQQRGQTADWAGPRTWPGLCGCSLSWSRKVHPGRVGAHALRL